MMMTMITSTARRIAALLAFLAFTLPASATSSGIDYTDQWWGGQAESGWGVNFIEQGTTIFATLFVYDANQNPTWYVATMNLAGGTTFSGSMYAVKGPYFGAPVFDTNSVVATSVGSMTVTFPNAYAGNLSYVVNGVTVTKSIVRQTFKANNIAGDYLGGMTAIASSCQNSSNNGAALIWGTLVVTQTGQTLSMAVNFFNGNGTAGTCTYNGVLTPQGVLGQVANGTFSCTVGGQASNAGTFNVDSISMQQTGFTGLFTGSDQFCSYNGYFGGVKDVL